MSNEKPLPAGERLVIVDESWIFDSAPDLDDPETQALYASNRGQFGTPRVPEPDKPQE